MQQLIDLSFTFKIIPKIIEMIPVTLILLFASLLAGFIIGFLTALSRIHRIPILNQISGVYVSCIRGTPFIIQLFLVYYALPTLLGRFHIDISFFTKTVFAIIAFSINAGAYLSEIIRASILNIEKGQAECAFSIGMNQVQAYWYVILPQAFKMAIPNIGNTVISLLKDTSLAFNIGIIDIMGRAKIIGGYSYRFFEVYLAAAIVYWGMSILFEMFFLRLETIFDREGRANRNAY